MFLPKHLPSFACATALLTLSPTAERIAFQPADGSRAPKEFKIEAEFELGDFSLTVDGQDTSGMLPLDQVAGSATMTFEVIDHFVKTVDGKSLELEREFVSSGAEWDIAEESGAMEDLSELDGETVVFKWNEDEQAYDKSYKDGDGDLQKLDIGGVELDYQGLLPGKQVASDERWKVEPARLASALFWGLDFSQLPELMNAAQDDPEFTQVFDSLAPQLAKLAEAFEAECTFAGTRDGDGVEVGVIQVAVNSDTSADLTDALLEVLQMQAEGEDVQIDINAATIDLEVRGQGELLWNLGAQRAHAFDMKADVTLTLDFSISVTTPDGLDHSAEASIELTGALTWKMEAGQ